MNFVNLPALLLYKKLVLCYELFEGKEEMDRKNTNSIILKLSTIFTNLLRFLVKKKLYFALFLVSGDFCSKKPL